MKNRWLLSSAVSIALGGVALMPVAAVAAEADAEAPVGLGEIIVTATRRETNLQDTPVAVSAIDSVAISQASPRARASASRQDIIWTMQTTNRTTRYTE